MTRKKHMPTADQPAAPEPVKPPARAVKPFADGEIQLAEFCYRSWCFDLAKLKSLDGKTITLADFMQPAFWSRNVDQIGVDDRIRVIAADRSFDFEFVVRGKAAGLGLLLEPNWSGLPGSAAYRALEQAMQSARAEIEAQRVEINREHGIEAA